MKTFLLIGNPNTGKTTLFNALTGLHQKVANYAGVTVEKKEGSVFAGDDVVRIIDLPGTYSLTPTSPDEEITTASLLGRSGQKKIHGVIVIVDGTNLSRNLYLATQIIDCGLPTILVINMIDEVRKKQIRFDRDFLAKRLGVPVVLTAAHKKQGLAELKALLFQRIAPPRPLSGELVVPNAVKEAVAALEPLLTGMPAARQSEALRLISRDDPLDEYPEKARGQLIPLCHQLQQQLESKGIDWRSVETECRYHWIDASLRESCLVFTVPPKSTFAERIDALLTHAFTGPVIFFAIMGLLFQGLFSWASWPMEIIDQLFGAVGAGMERILPTGPIQDLLADGVIAGIGGIVIFLPQIAFLFFFLALLEDSGYMARAAFVMDRFMAKFGLHGKAFIPLISSFACAIPGIMAARTIESKRDRLVTILIAPLMSCSARLPVYTLLIAACIPSLTLFGIFNLQGLVMWGLYALGIVAAVSIALLLKTTLLKTPALPFLIEFPPYRLPRPGALCKKTWERCCLFLTNAGTIIFALSIILWFLTSYPKADLLDRGQSPHAGTVPSIQYSFAGRLGRFIEPTIEPLGFDWKIGIGLIASFAAREVFVSTMAIVYSVDDARETSPSFIRALRADRRSSGEPTFTPLVAMSLLVFYVLACQCISTVAVVRRETNSWRWPLFMVGYMTLLAYSASLVVYQGGKWLGVG